MTTPMPPPEPLDAQERELARVLRALPGGEPPAALDAAILRAAANAAAASRRPGARLLASAGAMWGIGGAAAAVLALGVAIQMQYSPDRQPTMERAPQAQAVSDLAEEEAVQVELGEARDSAAAAAPPPPPMSPIADQPRPQKSLQRRREAASGPATSAAPPPPAAMPEPFTADALDEHVGRAANATEAVEAEAFAGEDKEVHAKAAAQAAAAPAPSRRERDARADTGAALGGLAAPREAAPMKPATWLAEIRRLRDEGKIEAARAKLVEFRQAYPQWVIPTDLAPLLSE